MEVEDVVVLNDKYDYQSILSAIGRTFTDDNPTMDAIARKFNKRVKYEVIFKEPFSSEKKYSSVTFKEGKYILGAPDILDTSDKMKELIDKYSDNRLVLLKSKKDNIALILLKDKIRYKAKNTLDYLRKENVDIKIISAVYDIMKNNIINNLEKLRSLMNKHQIDAYIVPTNDFINVDVDAVANVRISTKPELIRVAAKHFLNQDTDEISSNIIDEKFTLRY